MSHAFPRYNGPVRLEDCGQPGAGAELLIVEGLSAAQAVMAVRDARCQAVLPMQGKPVNAAKARKQHVMQNPLFQAVMSAVTPEVSLTELQHNAGKVTRPVVTANTESAEGDDYRPLESSELRYQRIVLLCDPDADGIHCSALLLIFIAKYLQPWLAAGRVAQVHAPMAKVLWTDSLGKTHVALSPTVEHAASLVEQLKLAGYTDVKRQHYRGLAGIDQEILKRCCVSPQSRNIRQLTPADADLALKYFGGG